MRSCCLALAFGFALWSSSAQGIAFNPNPAGTGEPLQAFNLQAGINLGEVDPGTAPALPVNDERVKLAMFLAFLSEEQDLQLRTGLSAFNMSWSDDAGVTSGIGSPSQRIKYVTPRISGYQIGLGWSRDGFTGMGIQPSEGVEPSFNGGVYLSSGAAGLDWMPTDLSLGDAIGGAGSEAVKKTLFSLSNYYKLIALVHPDDPGRDRAPVNSDDELYGLGIGARYNFSNTDNGVGISWEYTYNNYTGGVGYEYAYRVDLSCPTLLGNQFGDIGVRYGNGIGSMQGAQPRLINYRLSDRVNALSLGLRMTGTLPDDNIPSEDQYFSGRKTIGEILDGIVNDYDCSKALDRQVAAQAGAAGSTVPDPAPRAGSFPNDGFFHSRGSWGQKFDDQWGLKRIAVAGDDGKDSPWTEAGEPVTVAVVDSGIDYGHPELAGALWVNAADNPANGADDDNNLHVDDFLGWNFVDDNPVTFDDNGHGTFVAGIIAARIDNGVGMAGINPWARIMPVKVADHLGRSNSVDVAQGIAYAAHMGARVINVSIAGDTLTEIEQEAIDEAARAGALVVVAAGNDAENTSHISPAGLQGVITVAATDHEDHRAGYSNWGVAVDVSAPGSDILSLRAIQTDLLQFVDAEYEPGANIMGSNRHYYRLTGTSFAAPHVAGVASLLFSLNPDLTAADVRRMILHSARDIDVAGVDQNTGYGLLDAAAALNADPAFFIEAAVGGIEVAQVDGKPVVRVTGTADADEFKQAWVEIGAGEAPKKWKKAGSKITGAVRNGVLVDIEPAAFQGSEQWVLKVVTEHRNGRKREARFVLNLG